MPWNFDTIELIETLWNVNKMFVKRKWQYQKELIETLWNVNSVNEVGCYKVDAELIETLWNVNINVKKGEDKIRFTN